MSPTSLPAYPLILRNAVDADFVRYVIELVERRLPDFVDNVYGPNRKFLRLDDVSPDGDRVLYACKRRLADRFELGDYTVPPALKDFLTYITEGGFVHPHTDPDLPGKRHVRVNVLVKQTEGCLPIVDGWELDVRPGDAWLNLASLCEHATTAAIGPGYRSALSFGFQIDPGRCQQLFDSHRAWTTSASAVADASAS